MNKLERGVLRELIVSSYKWEPAEDPAWVLQDARVERPRSSTEASENSSADAAARGSEPDRPPAR